MNKAPTIIETPDGPFYGPLSLYPIGTPLYVNRMGRIEEIRYIGDWGEIYPDPDKRLRTKYHLVYSKEWSRPCIATDESIKVFSPDYEKVYTSVINSLKNIVSNMEENRPQFGNN